jgi:hypothetical protein
MIIGDRKRAKEHLALSDEAVKNSRNIEARIISTFPSLFTQRNELTECSSCGGGEEARVVNFG